MESSICSATTRKRLHSCLPWVQAAALIALWWLAQTLATALHWPIPGSLLALVILWLALDRGLVRLDWFEHGADNLLRHLMLFFVPAMLAAVDHPEFLSLLGVKLLVTVLLSTLIVMCGTACVVEVGLRLHRAHAR
ncbi:MAG: CidA/LrgA family protein [Verrucomicrobiota bacterium JB022]|nr:CidA/LrgA family protein [Verrucomicrobiota bacterium JB022]